MLVLVTVGRGPLNGKPPANPMAALGVPLCCGVWQVAQPAIRARYSPRFTGLDRSGGSSGAVKRCGALRTRYFTGKISSVLGRELRIGVAVVYRRRLDARSSSNMARYCSYGMRGNHVLSSWPIPSQTALAS